MSSSAPSSILVVGATGNTGASVVKHLSQHINSSPSTANLPRRVIALSRKANSAAAIRLSEMDHVEVQEQDWLLIDSSWLGAQNVVRVYLAAHNLPSQFVDESQFLVACKASKTIQYLVKLSTNPHYIAPDHPIYYGRIHWALEHMLQENEFKQQLHWTILRANVFADPILFSSIGAWKNEKDKPMTLLLDEHAPLAFVNPDDVGEVAAKLLSLPDPSVHFHKIYTVSGPEDIAGKDIVSYVEEIVQKKIKVEYKSEAVFKALVKQLDYPESVRKSAEEGLKKNFWTGLSQLANTGTSEEIFELAPPHSTVKQVIQQILQD